MTDVVTAEDPNRPQTNNGIITENGCLEEELRRAQMRPADIDADVREMERRKRVEMIMNSKLFREELERIIETQLKDGTGSTGLLQQISDMVGVNKQAGNIFKNSNCVVPINDIRGIESMGYSKGEKILRCKLAALIRLIDLCGWSQATNTLVTARLNQEDEQFLISPYGMQFHEITASSLIKVDMQGNILEQGTTNFPVNTTLFSLHAAVHASRPDIRCIIYVRTPAVVAVSTLKSGLLPLSQESVVIGQVSSHSYYGGFLDDDEKDKLARNLGPINKILLLSNQGALCCGQTIEEAFFNAKNTTLAAETQLKVLHVGLDNLVLLPDEACKKLYDAAHKPPDTSRLNQSSGSEEKFNKKWRVGGIEFEALMRMMDNAGFRTGYIYRQPLIKGDPPKPKNDVEVPPAVSSLGYLLEEEELYRQGIWKRIDGAKGDRSRWLNSPNVYQRVEILETGTSDPKKITKWVAEANPSHSSTPVKIDSALQFVPTGTNPKEFKQRQQQIKDYRRADKISAGPQSHILEGVTWDEARKMQDAAATSTGDQIVLLGAASKGIIQRGHQHNATVYKSPYAKNPFDSVTDAELEDYKKVVEKKAKGEYDTDFSESEGLSSHISKRNDGFNVRSPISITSETEDESRDEPQILRIETSTAPKPSQPEVVLSDVEVSPTEQFIRSERNAGINNYKDLEVQNYARNKVYEVMRHCYRTNNYSGFPLGSYIVPNPLHFHVARNPEITKAKRSKIVKLNARKIESSLLNNKKFQAKLRFSCNEKNIDFHVNGAHSIINLNSLKCKLENTTQVIDLTTSDPDLENETVQSLPPSNPGISNATRLTNDQSCQTTYLNHKHGISDCDNDPFSSLTIGSITLDENSESITIGSHPLSNEQLESFRTEIHFSSKENKPVVDTYSTIPSTPDVLKQDDSLNMSCRDFSEYPSSEENDLSDITSDLALLLPKGSSSSSYNHDSNVDLLEVTENSNSLNEFQSANLNNNNIEQFPDDSNITDANCSFRTAANTSVTDSFNIWPLTDKVQSFFADQKYEIQNLIVFPELNSKDISNFVLNLKEICNINISCINTEELEIAKLRLKQSIEDSLKLEDGRCVNPKEIVKVANSFFTISYFISEIIDRLFCSVDNDIEYDGLRCSRQYSPKIYSNKSVFKVPFKADDEHSTNCYIRSESNKRKSTDRNYYTFGKRKCSFTLSSGSIEASNISMNSSNMSNNLKLLEINCAANTCGINKNEPVVSKHLVSLSSTSETEVESANLIQKRSDDNNSLDDNIINESTEIKTSNEVNFYRTTSNHKREISSEKNEIVLNRMPQIPSVKISEIDDENKENKPLNNLKY